jgi:hypothetical protein
MSPTLGRRRAAFRGLARAVQTFLPVATVIMCTCAPSAQAPTDVNTPLTLPFAVSDYFAPTGAYGDAESPSSVTTSLACSSRAPDPQGSQGDCYQISYTTPVAGYAGVFWQFPPNNWGGDEGRRVSPGATKVTGYARADGSSPVPVTFGVGGIGMGSTTSEPYKDTISSTTPVVLDDQWRAFTVPISGTYDWVLGGFTWEATTMTPITFYIDDIQWQ